VTPCFICRFALALYDGLVFAELAWLRDDKADTAMLLGRLRWNLTIEARKAVNLLQCEGIPPTVENLTTRLVLTVGTATPRSRFVPWHLDDVTVEQMIAVVAKEVAAKEVAAAA
jgi:hypothetical protein